MRSVAALAQVKRNVKATQMSEGPLHAAADAHVARLSVAFRYAFAVGRKAVKSSPKNAAGKTTAAMKKALERVLPNMLAAVLVDGGRVAIDALTLKALGGPGSGNFNHLGRPGSIGGSAPVTFGAGDASRWQQQALSEMLSDVKGVTFLAGDKTYEAGDSGWKSNDCHSRKVDDQGVCDLPTDDVAERGVAGMIRAGIADGRYLEQGQQLTIAKAMVADVKREQKLSPLSAYVLAAVADNASTIQFLANKTAEEKNPAINWIGNPAAMLAVGVGMDAAAIYSWMKLTKDHKKVQKVGLYAVTLLRTGLALNNVSLDNNAFPGGQKVTNDRRRIVFQMRAMEDGAMADGSTEDGTISTLADGPLRMRFDVKNPSIVEWARKHAAELIANVLDTTRERIRIASENFQDDGDWDFYADRIMAAVGDEQRADLIARHETMLAAGEGQRQGWDQALEEGLLNKGVKRVWIVTPDERLCPVCVELEDETASLDGQYKGGFDGPPAHVACRCTEGIQ